MSGGLDEQVLTLQREVARLRNDLVKQAAVHSNEIGEMDAIIRERDTRIEELQQLLNKCDSKITELYQRFGSVYAVL